MIQPRHLRVRRARQTCPAGALALSSRSTAYCPAPERVDLLRRDGALAGPVERDDQRVLAVGEHVVGACAAERLEMRRRRAAVRRSGFRSGIPNACRARSRAAARLCRARASSTGIGAQVGAHEVAALQIDQHVEHVGAHADEVGSPRAAGGTGARRASRCGRRCGAELGCVERRQRLGSGRRRRRRRVAGVVAAGRGRRSSSRSSTSCRRATAARGT